jgi:hypothetical protein
MRGAQPCFPDDIGQSIHAQSVRHNCVDGNPAGRTLNLNQRKSNEKLKTLNRNMTKIK